jgi:hypothetical protein
MTNTKTRRTAGDPTDAKGRVPRIEQKPGAPLDGSTSGSLFAHVFAERRRPLFGVEPMIAKLFEVRDAATRYTMTTLITEDDDWDDDEGWEDDDYEDYDYEDYDYEDPNWPTDEDDDEDEDGC